MKVYVSSSYKDLIDYRDRVCRVLRRSGYQVVCMEDDPADDPPPVKKCLQDVAGCDVYVGIIAWRYGDVPPKDQFDKPNERSFTELEYRHAWAKRLHCVLFLQADEGQWPAELRAKKDREKLESLRKELEQTHYCRPFLTPAELALEVDFAVRQYQQSIWLLRPLHVNLVSLIFAIAVIGYWFYHFTDGFPAFVIGLFLTGAGLTFLMACLDFVMKWGPRIRLGRRLTPMIRTLQVRLSRMTRTTHTLAWVSWGFLALFVLVSLRLGAVEFKSESKQAHSLPNLTRAPAFGDPGARYGSGAPVRLLWWLPWRGRRTLAAQVPCYEDRSFNLRPWHLERLTFPEDFRHRNALLLVPTPAMTRYYSQDKRKLRVHYGRRSKTIEQYSGGYIWIGCDDSPPNELVLEKMVDLGMKDSDIQVQDRDAWLTGTLFAGEDLSPREQQDVRVETLPIGDTVLEAPAAVTSPVPTIPDRRYVHIAVGRLSR